MKALLSSPRAATAALALLAALSAAAQSLGPARAQAWIGRPLDLSVPARFDGPPLRREPQWQDEQPRRDALTLRGVTDSAPRHARMRVQLTPDVVLATIRTRYLSGVERCYRRHLKKDSSARGRVLVSFTVDPKGRARDGEAKGITDRVDDCIAAQVARWQFPRPQEEARFALGLELGVD